MATSALTIASNALILLGDQPISSFKDGDAGALIAAHLYDATYQSMLTETLWHFATRTALLAKLSAKPDNGYLSKFQIPQDCLYVVKTDTHTRYEIYEREIYTNTTSLKIEYIYKVDEVNLPVYFAKALEYNLASLFAIPLTGNVSRAEFYRKLYIDELKKARRADASQRPAYTMGNDRLIAVRHI